MRNAWKCEMPEYAKGLDMQKAWVYERPENRQWMIMVTDEAANETNQWAGQRISGRNFWCSVARLAVASQPVSQGTQRQVFKPLPTPDELPTNEHQAVEYCLVNMHFLEGRLP